ncbi:alcohol dehydrogenase [Hephaestia caeni]|uniref:Alcohol dehydrogenase n=1 Tax=Hephaestia caeni TaxID=645617 RepID=A0A397PEA3_9SPHN|nr:iron-containing alcohol dehydrogenase [Hephaestia caeni]RIA45545.1 alcohol dehydrogenase [Hephaestia caeni]
MTDLTTPITLERPTLLHFGTGSTAEIGRYAAAEQARRTLVIADPFNATRVEVLGLAGDVTVFDAITREPDDATLAAARAMAMEAEPELIVGFGGGSAMDLAKVVAVLHGTALSLMDIAGPDRAPSRRVRLAQVATTAGTGSEAGTRALITNSATHAKIAVESRHLLADVAVLDPLMTASLPPAVTAETGVDALAHCVEAFTNVKAHPLIDHYAREGIRLVGRYLSRAVAHGDDLEARAGMALASLYGGYCLGPVNTAGGHAVAYPLSTQHGIGHGAANAIVFPHMLAFNVRDRAARTHEICRALGWGTVGDNTVFEAAYRFCADLGIEMRLSRRGIGADAVPKMAEEAFGIRRLLDNNPRVLTRDDIERLYQAAL